VPTFTLKARGMETFTFALILSGDSPLDHLDELFEAGCDDATFGERDAVLYAEFDREAPSFVEAVASAVQQIESVGGLRVLRVEPDDYVTASGIAERTKRSRESVRQLYQQLRGPGNFPTPVAWLDGHRRLWRWSEVAEWFRDSAGENICGGQAKADLIGAYNAALEMRKHLSRLGTKERELVTRLIKKS